MALSQSGWRRGRTTVVHCLRVAYTVAFVAYPFFGETEVILRTAVMLLSQWNAMIWTFLLESRPPFAGTTSLDLPTSFGIFCFNFVWPGLLMLWVDPMWTRSSRYPWRFFALYLILLQSPLSFIADYLKISEDTYWHVVDRLAAVATSSLAFGKLAFEVRNKAQCPGVSVAYGVIMVVAVYCFAKSQEAQTLLDRDGYVLWHNLWHMYPLTACAICLFDFYLLGGWKKSARQLYSIEIHHLKSSKKRVD